jgi:putative hemolysin
VETLSTLLVLILIAASGFLNGSEVAVFSLSKIQLKQMRERFKSSHRTIKRLLGDPAGLLAAILVSNEVINIALSTLISNAVSSSHHESAWMQYLSGGPLSRLPIWAIDVVLGTLVASPILLILCEITPKVISARVNTLVAPLCATPLGALYYTLAPIRFSVGLVERLVKKLMPGTKNEGPLMSTSSKLREEDFLTMVEEAQKEGTVQSSELGLIRNVFDLDDTPVIEIATPLSRVFMLAQTTTVGQALSSMKEGSNGQRYSRIPVYGKTRADIVGLLYSKDLLVARLEKMDPTTPISELMWKPFFVNSSTRLNSLFRKMKKQRTHLALVTNDQSIPIGVATMNDVLEALLDELILPDDEDDEEVLLP